MVSIWDEEGRPYMQAVHFCFAFGGILSPLLSEPFLAKKKCISESGVNKTGKVDFLAHQDYVSGELMLSLSR